MPQSVLFRLPTDMAGCPEGGPFLAEASLGPYPGRRRFSGSFIDCPSSAEPIIDATYGHLAADAERVELDLLDAYNATCGRGLAIGMSED